MIELDEHEGMIRRLAWECYRKLPNAYLSLEEVEQEGRIVFIRLRRKRLRMNSTFSTLLYRSLQNRFKDLIREGYAVKRLHERSSTEVEECYNQHSSTPEELVILKQFMDYLYQVDPDLADFFLHGPSDELERFAFTRHMRRISMRRTRTEKAEGTMISKACLEEFFGLSFSNLLRQFNIGRLFANIE